jgi:hypothetical protein
MDRSRGLADDYVTTKLNLQSTKYIERVLFIGTQFSILYTSIYSSAGAAIL